MWYDRVNWREILDLHEWYISACPWHLQLPCFSPSFSLYAFTTFTFNNALYVYDHSPLSPSWTPFWVLSWLWCRRFKVLTRRPLSLRTTVTNKQHVRLKCITHYQTQEKKTKSKHKQYPACHVSSTLFRTAKLVISYYDRHTLYTTTIIDIPYPKTLLLPLHILHPYQTRMY